MDEVVRSTHVSDSLGTVITVNQVDQETGIIVIAVTLSGVWSGSLILESTKGMCWKTRSRMTANVMRSAHRNKLVDRS